MNSNRNALIAEFAGTFALILFGAGACIWAAHTGPSHGAGAEGRIGIVGIAFAHGWTLMMMVYALGRLSGAHFNTAVSLAMWFQGKLTGDRFLLYTVAQLLGALAAAGVLALLFPDEIELARLGTPTLANNIHWAAGLAIEMAITFALVFVILLVTQTENLLAGAAIGATLFIVIILAGDYTGAAANPMRFLGPAIISHNLQQIPVYLAGPLAGGLFASVAFDAYCRRFSASA